MTKEKVIECPFCYKKFNRNENLLNEETKKKIQSDEAKESSSKLPAKCPFCRTEFVG